MSSTLTITGSAVIAQDPPIPGGSETALPLSFTSTLSAVSGIVERVLEPGEAITLPVLALGGVNPVSLVVSASSPVLVQDDGPSNLKAIGTLIVVGTPNTGTPVVSGDLFILNQSLSFSTTIRVILGYNPLL
jgi:hypothetical protein